jgi:hypothetical protein
MAAVIEAIGLISGVLGIIQFGIDNLPEKDSVGSKVRVTVGLDVSGGLSNAGGDLPDIRLFNEAGDFLGITADPGKVDSGGFGDITIDHDKNSANQAAYALFSANDDAICIAYASITWPSGDQYAWVGDWGRQCGGSWYYSNQYIGASGVKPDCLWIDGNGDQPQTGFQVHWPEFANKGDSTLPESPDGKADRTNYLCTAGWPFQMYTEPDPRGITYKLPDTKRSVAERAYGPSKRPVSARFQQQYARSNGTQPNSNTPASMVAMLVVGDSPEHSAEGLCTSATSYGPDFFNILTGTFCRMSDKTTWPVCDGVATTDNCFNKDLNQLVIHGVTARDEPYRKVVDWTSGN